MQLHFVALLVPWLVALCDIVATQSPIAFTVLPTRVEAGKSVTLRWNGGDGSVSFSFCKVQLR